MTSLPRLAAFALLAAAVPATAAPGVGDPIYGATVTKGLGEIEARFGRLVGGSANSDDGLVIEGEYGVSKRLSLAVLVETGRLAGGGRTVDAVAVEAVRTLGHFAPLKLMCLAILVGAYLKSLFLDDKTQQIASRSPSRFGRVAACCGVGS